VHIIRFPGMTPDVRANLPLGVAAGLLPVALAQDRIAAERRRK
jgi:hypothetical protein